MKTSQNHQQILIKLCFGILLIAILLMEFDASITKANNSYIESKAFIEVRVLPGESVWSIASRYVTDKDDVRELIMAIRQRNELSANAEIFAGQTLKVPMKAHNHSNTIISAAAKTGN